VVVFIAVVVDVVALSVGLELVGYVVFVRPTIIPIIDTLNDYFTIHDDGIIIMLSSSKRKLADIKLLLILLFGWLVQLWSSGWSSLPAPPNSSSSSSSLFSRDTS
jgi:hypothetical protein